MTIWDGAAGRKEAEAGAARSQGGFIDQQSGRSTEQVKLRTPSLGEKQVLQAGVTRRVLQLQYGGCDHSRKLNFLLGAGFELGKSTTSRAWLFHPFRSIRWKLRVWVWVGQGVLQTQSFSWLPFSFHLKGTITIQSTTSTQFSKCLYGHRDHHIY